MLEFLPNSTEFLRELDEFDNETATIHRTSSLRKKGFPNLCTVSSFIISTFINIHDSKNKAKVFAGEYIPDI